MQKAIDERVTARKGKDYKKADEIRTMLLQKGITLLDTPNGTTWRTKMIEVRFHGRGGQGAVTSAEIVAQAAINEGLYAQAFPNFGPERRGAPVLAFLRVSDKPIRIRSKVYQPDVIVILDPTLLLSASPTDGLKKEGFVVINSNKPGG